jgi:hypothetical protein
MVYRSQTTYTTALLMFLREPREGHYPSDSYDLEPDDPRDPVDIDSIDPITTVDRVPDPRGPNSAWVCQNHTRNHTSCNTVRLLFRVMNNMKQCTNPKCDGTRDMAIDAYEVDEGSYRAKFHEAVRAKRRIVNHNEPILPILLGHEQKPSNIAPNVRLMSKTGRDFEEAERSRNATLHSLWRASSFIGFPLGDEVPRLVTDCVEVLMSRVHEEGMFRVPGSKQRVEQLMEAYKQGNVQDLKKETTENIAGLLKKFLLQLQSRLLGPCDEKVGDNVNDAMKHLSTLKRGNLHVLGALLPLLAKVANTPVNKMDANNLGRSLLGMFEDPKAQLDQALIAKCYGFISLLIQNADAVADQIKIILSARR